MHGPHLEGTPEEEGREAEEVMKIEDGSSTSWSR
jgi:hypothetical protein